MPTPRARVVADPHAALPTQNYKYVTSCTELFLAHRGLDALANFEGFVNLEVLWLNGNRLEALDGLDACVRIKQLYAQGNRVRSLAGSSLDRLRFLATLRLNDNKLRDLEATLRVLAKLRHLEDLDLYGNPLQEEDNYRLHVVRAVPSLQVLDRHVVTDDERRRASRLRDGPPLPSSSSSSGKPKKTLVAGAPPQTMSSTVKLLLHEVERATREEEAQRQAEQARQLALLAQQQQQLVSTSSSSAHGAATARHSTGGLDAWELAALEKAFRRLEDKPKAGVAADALPSLVDHLTDRGYRVVGRDGRELSPEGSPTTAEALAAVITADAKTKTSWPQLTAALADGRLRCERMAADELATRAEQSFRHAAAALHKRAAATPEIHAASQRAYHLSTLAEQARAIDHASPRGSLATTAEKAGEARTKFVVSAFSRDAVATAAFHELKEQSAQVPAELAAKYKLQQKDFHKYLLRQAPPATTLVRRQFHL